MELAVAPGCRNRGLGAELLREAAVAAIAQGCVQIELACNTLRTDAHRFYEREGFKRYHYKFSKPLAGSDNGNAWGDKKIRRSSERRTLDNRGELGTMAIERGAAPTAVWPLK